MPKHYKDMIDELINKIEEDGEGAPTNAVAHGGVDMNPNGKKKKDDAEDVLRRTIMNKLGNRIKESDDNNNVTLRDLLMGCCPYFLCRFSRGVKLTPIGTPAPSMFVFLSLKTYSRIVPDVTYPSQVVN